MQPGRVRQAPDRPLHNVFPPDVCSFPLPVKGVVTFFYYEDVRAAADFYERVLGLRRRVDYGWCAIYELLPGSCLGLVDATAGSQRPIAGRNKGAIVSLEMDDLDEWLERMKRLGAAAPDAAVTSGCAGQTREFKILDPGGYTVEFFTWVDSSKSG